MVFMLRRLLWASWAMLFAVPLTCLACTCQESTPGACQGLNVADAIFVGTVTVAEIVPAANADDPQVLHYRFRVDERFKGAENREIDVFSGGNDADCGYRFKKGAQYLVFPYSSDDGRLFATICSGTRPAREARAILPQLRAMKRNQRVASIFGVLRRTDPPYDAVKDPEAAAGDPTYDSLNDFDEGGSPTDRETVSDSADDPGAVGAAGRPLGHIELKIRSRIDRFETSTGPSGVYSIYGVPGGEYQIIAHLPAHMELTLPTLKGGLPPLRVADGGCYEYDIAALPTGEIRGRVLGPDGKALPTASVELYRTGRYEDAKSGWWEFQTENGGFSFDHVATGDYILVFNRQNHRDPNSPYRRTFYPAASDLAAAQPVKVSDGGEVVNADIRVKAGFATRTVKVRVKWTGRPLLGNVFVTAKADEGENPASRKVSDGLFELTLLDDIRYTISAWTYAKIPRSASGGPPSPGTPPAEADPDPPAAAGAGASVTGDASAAPAAGAAVAPATPVPDAGPMTCGPGGRIETYPTVVNPADAPTKEIVVTFPKPTCGE
jgi:hypothetical protein